MGFDLDGFGSCKLLTACCRVCATRYFQFRWNLMLKKNQTHETWTKIRQRDRRLLQMTFSWLMPACSIRGVLRNWVQHLRNLEKTTVNDTEMLFLTLNGKESAFFRLWITFGYTYSLSYDNAAQVFSGIELVLSKTLFSSVIMSWHLRMNLREQDCYLWNPLLQINKQINKSLC